MFKINVSQFMKGYDFEVCGTSYIGNPKSNTAMLTTALFLQSVA